jgi:multidrug efflux pump subunit AcrB
VVLLHRGPAGCCASCRAASFRPEDQGYLFGFVTLPDGASAQRTGVAAEKLRGIANDPHREHLHRNGMDFITGNNRPAWPRPSSSSSPGTSAPSPRAKWPASSCRIGMSLPDGMGLVFNPPPIQGLGTAGGFEVYVQNRADGDPRKLAGVTAQFVEAPACASRTDRPEHLLPRVVAAAERGSRRAQGPVMGIPLDSIYATLQASDGRRCT